LRLDYLFVAVGANLDHALVIPISRVGDPQHMLAGWN
jgi:hypothetical protein